MSILDRPMAALASAALLTAAAVWGEYDFLRSPASDGLNLRAVVLALLGWLGVLGLLGAVYRRMRADARRRIASEQAADQGGRLMRLTALLGGTRTSATAIEAILQEPAYALHADAAMVLALSDDRRLATVARAIGYGKAPESVAIRQYSILDDVINRGVVVTRHSTQVSGSEPPKTLEDGWASGEALAVVPLIIERRVAALLVLAFHAPRHFSPNDRELLDEVGTRGSQALERIRQYESVERARVEAETLRRRADAELAERQRTERALRASESQYRALAARTSRLHDLTAALSEAVTLDAVAAAVIEHGRVLAGATDGEVFQLTDEGTHFQPLYSRDAQGERMKAAPGLSLTHAMTSRTPVFISSLAEWQEKYWESAAEAADRGYASMAVLPLLVESKAIGVLVFRFSAPVNFEDSYRTTLIAVAQHCAQALDRTRMYEAAERARAEAEAANRHKDEFLSMISHELRTPLNAILGWASMLQEGILEPAAIDRAVRSIHNNASRQSKLVEELLDISRILSGRTNLDTELIDLTKLLGGVVESMSPLAVSNGVDLRIGTVPEIVLEGDMRRLEQVFLNLLTNAMKFTPSGGSITLSARADGDALEISVEDTGIGIEADFLPYVFDRFRQADSTSTRGAGGLGLGLAIAKHIVEAHKGAIAAQSAGPGKGATFTVRLPMAAVPANRRSRDVPPPGAGRRETDNDLLKGVRVLVVDDESDSRDIIARALEARGARVTTAKSASDGFAVVIKGAVDVLLADISMPVEDGYSLMRRIREHADGRVSSLPAIAVTAAARVEEQRQALAAGFQLHIAKPVEPANLARYVKQVYAAVVQDMTEMN
jgi:signal transduction histidine kinase/ActR/RegA family two-component response regulator